MSDLTFDPSTPATNAPAPAHGEPAIGAMVLAFFGTCWMVITFISGFRQHIAELACLGTLGAILFGTAYTMHRATQKNKRGLPLAARSPAEVKRDAMFNRINIMQWLAVGLAILVLNVVQHQAWIVPAIILIVGLHFVPLARLFNVPFYHLLALALVVISVGLPFMVSDGPQSIVLPLATGAALWVGSVYDILLARVRARA